MHIPEVAAEEIVEFCVMVRRMVVAVPPEPVAAFGDQQLLPGQGATCWRKRSAVRIEGASRGGELLPGAMIVPMSRPDVKVGVDPGTGEHGLQSAGVAAHGLRHRHSLDVQGRLEFAVQSPQKRPAAAWVMFPGILAIEDDGNGRVLAVAASAARRETMSGISNAGQEVMRGRFRLPGLINKPNPIRQLMIAEHAAYGSSVASDLVRAVQGVGGNGALNGSREDVLIRGGPCEPLLMQKPNDLVGDRSLGRPDALGVAAENLAVKLARAPHLLHRVVWSAKEPGW